jgi:hypothetical protein
MRFRTAPVVWALLAAIIVNIVVFDLLVLDADDPGLGDLIIAGALGMTSGLLVFYAASWLIRRR